MNGKSLAKVKIVTSEKSYWRKPECSECKALQEPALPALCLNHTGENLQM